MADAKILIKTNFAKIGHRLKGFIKKFSPITKNNLENALDELGIKEGDTVFVHSSFNSMGLFDGTPLDVINILLRVIGRQGNLLMPTFPMRGFTKDYLDSDPTFDAIKTPSSVGIITEIFRRMEGVRRSIHPTHSVAAFGPKAEWFVQDHHKHTNPFEAGTPFAKLYESGGKILLLGAGLERVTQIHMVEDILKEKLPAPLYLEKPYNAKIIINGRAEEMPTYVHNPLLSRRRRIRAVYPYLKKAKIFKSIKLGVFYALPIVLFDVRMFVDELIKLSESGKYNYIYR